MLITVRVQSWHHVWAYIMSASLNIVIEGVYGSSHISASPLGNGAQGLRILQTYFQIYPSNLLDRGRVYPLPGTLGF